MRKASRSTRRLPSSSGSANAKEANIEADTVIDADNVESVTHNESVSAESGNADDNTLSAATGTPVFRSTRLRAGHTSKIDYLKLHNTTSTDGAAFVQRGAQLPGSASESRKRQGSLASSTTPSGSDKRPKLTSGHSPTALSYSCPLCDLYLSSLRNLEQHIAASHKQASSLGALECVFCGLGLRTVKALQNHYVKQHRVHAPMPDSLNLRLTKQCRACGQSFRTAEHLARHMDWAHTRCSSIVLMEKLPEQWRWQRDKRTIMECADAVEEEFDLAFPARRSFYRDHPDLLEADMSIQLQPASAAGAEFKAAASADVDVYAFEDESSNVDMDASVIAKPRAGAKRGRKPLNPQQHQQHQHHRQRAHSQKRRVTTEIDFDQLLAQRDEALDNEIDEPIEGQLSPKHKQQQRQPRRPRQQPEPFVSETPHYVSSRATVSSVLQSFPCPICMLDMATLKSRDRHLVQRHPGVRAFACLECDLTFETYISLRRHVRAEHPLAESGAYKLLIAPGLRRRARQRVVSSSATLAAAAIAAAAGNNGSGDNSFIQPFLCTICGASFNRVSQLSAHYAAAHEGVKQDRQRFRQQLRGSAIQDSAGGESPIEADDLDASGGSLGGNATLDELKLTCEMCSAQFEKITALERHIAFDHVDETPFECHQCPAYFPTLGRLRHHQRTVHRFFMQWKEPPQAVLSKMQSRSPTSAAGNGASTVLNLAVPLRRVDMAKVAYQQLRFFEPQSAANINLDTVLSGIAPLDTVIFCAFCGEACHNKLELGRHLQSHSGKRLRFGCARCGQVFEGWNAKMDLVDHMKVDHLGKPRYRCNQCEAQFKFSSLLKQHRERGCNSTKPLARPIVSYGCATCERIICGEQSAERYQQHVQVCRGPLHRNLPSSAATQPTPTAVISGLDSGADSAGGGVVGSSSILDMEDGAGDELSAASSMGSRTVQVTLPGSKEPVSVLIHLEGPVNQETLNQAFIVQSALSMGSTAAETADAETGADAQAQQQQQQHDVEPLQSLAQFAAAAADAADAEAAANSAASVDLVGI